MRMRKKAHLEDRMERQSERLVADPAALRGHWRSLMPACREVRLELGCGKGKFTAETARQEPDVLFVALERVADAMVIAMERCDALGLSNVWFIDADARAVPDYFAPGELDRVYLNFSDPWPASGQAKRRLTHPDFLRAYARALREGGEIHFKTDNTGLFEWSLFQFPKAGYALRDVTRDLHAQGPQGVMTDYEEKFVAQGKPINRCVAVKGSTLSARLKLTPRGSVEGASGDPDEPPAGALFEALDGEGAPLGRAVIPPTGAAWVEIDPAHRRRGYGVELLGLALAYCRDELGLQTVELRCGGGNAAAIRTILHYPAVRVDLDYGAEPVRRYKVTLR